MGTAGYLTPDELILVQSDGNMFMAKKPGLQFLAFKEAAKSEANINMTIAKPAGAYRDHVMDYDMHHNPNAKQIYGLTIGLLPYLVSKHCLGICFDAQPYNNTWINNNAARFGFYRTVENDLNHFEYNGTTVTISTQIELEGDNQMGNYGIYQRTDNGVVTLAIGILDPNWRTPGRNFWWEGVASQWRDVTDYFGPAKPIPNDTWNSRSNDPNRISDLTKFPEFGVSQVTIASNNGSTVTINEIIEAFKTIKFTTQSQ